MKRKKLKRQLRGYAREINAYDQRVEQLAAERDQFKARAWKAEKALKAAGLPYQGELSGHKVARDWEWVEAFAGLDRCISASGLRLGKAIEGLIRMKKFKAGTEVRKGDALFLDEGGSEPTVAPRAEASSAPPGDSGGAGTEVPADAESTAAGAARSGGAK